MPYRAIQISLSREAVADTGVGVDVARADLAAQVRDVDAQDLDVVGVLRSPDLDQQRAVGEQAAAVGGQRAQEVELDRRQVDRLAVDADRVGGEVEAQAV